MHNASKCVTALVIGVVLGVLLALVTIGADTLYTTLSLLATK
jgi:multisubunit Na+/H+ antiporter MnhG subunit